MTKRTCRALGICEGPVVDDAPVPLCRHHLLTVYEWVKDDIAAVERQAMLDRIARGEDRRRRDRPDRRTRGGSVVYYIQRGDLIKIGTTRYLQRRLLQVGGGTIVAIEPGSFALESLRHRQFASDRRVGEWFAASETLVSHVRMLREHFGSCEVADSV